MYLSGIGFPFFIVSASIFNLVLSFTFNTKGPKLRLKSDSSWRTRRRGVPRSSKFGDMCSYNTDCLQNMYCPAGACICLPGFVDIGNDCVSIISPGQSGCTVDRQCDGAWPSAKCSNGQCVCPNGQFVVETQDGLACFTAGRCPLPEGYSGPLTSTLDGLSSDVDGCLYLAQSKTDPEACFANGRYVGDIYDCIPLHKPATEGAAGHCCPTKALTCIQPKATIGGTENRYWYNSITGTCESFSWNSAGTVGNSNNFRAYEHCMAYCSSACKRGTPKLASGKHLRCTANEGCSDSGLQQYTCTRTGSGQNCCPTKDFICSNAGGRNSPEMKQFIFFDTGANGLDMLEGGAGTRWRWDGDQCQPFAYSGQAGNFNNFLSFEDCQTFCGTSFCQQGEPLRTAEGSYQKCSASFGCPTSYECVRTVCCPKKQTVCIQPKVVGGCIRPVQRFWYNGETKDCETMIYSGCNGNDNNFASYLECQQFCKETVAQPKCIHGEPDKDLVTGRYATCSSIESTSGNRNSNQCRPNYECYFDGSLFGCCPTQAYTCSLQMQAGSLCVAPTIRWFYDTSSQTCKNFQYMGCNGNSNNFLTRSQCDQYCGVSVCPYGAEPLESTRRVCKDLETCPEGYQCVSTRPDKIGYCCPTRTKICTNGPDQGQHCSDPSERFYFNVATKQCTLFTYFGCGGNGNRFATLSQCFSFCATTECEDGETVHFDINSQQPATCNVHMANSCPIGFKCKFNELTGRNVCCGKKKSNFCSNGGYAFTDALTDSPLECNRFKTKICPKNYMCQFSEVHKRYYCCLSSLVDVCPKGKVVFTEQSSGQPTSCFISVNNQCPEGFYCQTHSINSTQGFCCSNYDICPNGASYLTNASSGLPQTCSARDQQCPTGYTCHSVLEKYDTGFCCPNTFIVLKSYSVTEASTTSTPETMDGCPVGQVAFKDSVRSEVKICLLDRRNTCPAGYSCHYCRTHNRNQCCGLQAECPNGSVAYINPKSGWVLNCPSGVGCPKKFTCRENNLCCTDETQDSQIDPTDSCPVGYNVYVAQGASGPWNCIKKPCPAGTVCVFSLSTRRYVCCVRDMQTVNDGTSVSNITVQNACDETENKDLGEECCSTKQCSYSCKKYKDKSICICPSYLLLDISINPKKCVQSCSGIREGAICRSST